MTVFRFFVVFQSDSQSTVKVIPGRGVGGGEEEEEEKENTPSSHE